MTMDTGPRAATARSAMLIGLLLTVLAGAAPLLDLATTDLVGDHVRAAYPQWPADTVSGDRNAIVAWLVGGSVLGLIGWWTTQRAVRRSARRGRLVGLGWLALGAIWSLLTLSVGGEAYDVIVPTVFGVLTLLPVLAGCAVVYQLWRETGRLRGV